MSDEIRVNGNLYSWGSIIVKFADGEKLYGFTGISYGDKRERVKGYGAGRAHAPYGRSSGKYSTDPVKITGWLASIQAFRAALASRSADGVSYGNVEFEVIVQAVEPDNTPLNTEIERCTWAANTTSLEESADPLKEECELDCMYIRRNGLTLFDASEGVI